VSDVHSLPQVSSTAAGPHPKHPSVCTCCQGFAAGWVWNRQLPVVAGGSLVPRLRQALAALPKHPALALWLVQPPGSRWGWTAWQYGRGVAPGQCCQSQQVHTM
jgi:hypothetical protein